MFWKSLLSLFLQSNCPLCDRGSIDTICEDCRRRLLALRWDNPSQYWQGEIPLFVWGSYGGQLKRSIAACKYENHPEIAESLGFWLGEAWRNSCLWQQYPQLIVVPIPLHQNRLQQRGFNQAEIIARGFCQVTRYSLKKQGLRRIRDTEAMFSLKTAERSENLRRAFVVGKDFRQNLPQSPILLVDDIYTTGTTVREAAQTLRQHCLQVAGVASVCSPRSSL
jgi:ComF family protein